MKILSNVLFTLFFCLLFAFGALQTPLAKHYFKKRIISYAASQKVELTIGKIQGLFPCEWVLQDVCIHYQDTPLTIGTLRLRICLSSFFKKKLEISYAKLSEGSYQNLPFEAVAQGKVSSDHHLTVSHFVLEGKDLFVRFRGKIYPNWQIKEADLAFNIPDFSFVHPLLSKGKGRGVFFITKKTAHFQGVLDNLPIASTSLAPTFFTLDAQKNATSWQGALHFKGGAFEIPLQGGVNFQFAPTSFLLSLTDFQIRGPETFIFGKATLNPYLKHIEGSLLAELDDLKVFRPLFPEACLKGSLGAKIDFESQNVKCQVEINHFGIQQTSCQSLLLEGNFVDLFGELKGEFFLEGQTIAVDQIAFSKIELKSTFQPHASPFAFTLKGFWKNPLEITSKGTWQKRKEGLFLNINNLDGFALKTPFALCEPFSLEWNSECFKMSNFSIDLAKGHLSSRIDLTKTTSLIKVKAEQFPLEFLPLANTYFSLNGTTSFTIDLMGWGANNFQGSCNLTLPRAYFISENGNNFLTTKGSLQMHLNNNQLQFHTELKTHKQHFIQLTGNIPIHHQHFPFKFALDKDKAFMSQLVAEGRLEDLFDFINIGHHRVAGWVSCALNFSKTFQSPFIQGEIELQDGVYENFYTGTYLNHLSAKAFANQQTIHIKTFDAVDLNEGKVQATGSLLLSPSKNFPFTLNAHLEKFNIVSFDTIAGDLSGSATIQGDRLGAVAEGKLTVTSATFRIPDQLPKILPDLPIVFINPPENLARKKNTQPVIFPLKLNLNLDVPDKAYVEGKGLNCQLKGKLDISGTYTDMLAKGKLQLINGEYIFSGKVFDLTEGEVLFNDKPTPSAYISLSGSCDLPDANVMVRLRGPLSSPKLSFNSSPQLPINSLLAQILFNKDISEISAIQALQIAQTVISLSGNSRPDILEKIRKTLGVDRLTLITSENDPGKISLQIGKYLMKGVLLTLSQGAENRNVSVEVDLQKGIKFQAEVGENRQGKFSLKWHHHY